MSQTSDLTGVAWSGLKARKFRTFMLMLGPIIGVAAMVSAIGLTESAKGHLQAQLASLGTNLIIAKAGSSFGSQNPTLPADAVQRVENVSTVVAASASASLSGVIALPATGTSTYYQAFPVPVRAADVNLPSVLKVSMVDGRWLEPVDTTAHMKSVVLGQGIARQYGYLPGEVRTIELNGHDFGVVGVLGTVTLDPTLDNAAFVTEWAAQHILGTNGRPNQLYVRSTPSTTQATANAMQAALNLGASTPQVSTTVPSDALKAAAQANSTLQTVAFMAGLLALIVGGIGIANVMSISVVQRSAEIGIRRAVGHSRSTIAFQFLLESLFVGVLGGFVGALLGIGVVYGTSELQSWVTVITYNLIPLWMLLALGVAVIFGLFPSIKAARLEPLETLRLG